MEYDFIGLFDGVHHLVYATQIVVGSFMTSDND